MGWLNLFVVLLNCFITLLLYCFHAELSYGCDLRITQINLIHLNPFKPSHPI